MKEKIQRKLAEIIRDVLKVDINTLPEEAKAYPLLSGKFGIEPYQMIVFMETVEEKFQIKIPDSAIVERKFNTYNDIVDIIISQKGA